MSNGDNLDDNDKKKLARIEEQLKFTIPYNELSTSINNIQRNIIKTVYDKHFANIEDEKDKISFEKFYNSIVKPRRPNVIDDDYIEFDVTRNLIEEHLSGKQNRRLLIWSLLNLDAWMVSEF